METPISSDAPRPLFADVAIIVPAHNEADEIGTLCEQLHARCPNVLVIDDGSTDDTGAVAARAGALVLRNTERLGKGKAISDGLAWAAGRTVEWIALIDGDNQHTVVDLERLIAFAKETACDLAIGQRPFTRAMPLGRRAANTTLSFILRLVTGRAIPDSQCGLRVFPKKWGADFRPVSAGYEVESEMIIRAARLNLKIGLLPIQTIYPAEWKSSIRPVRDAVRWLQFVFRMK